MDIKNYDQHLCRCVDIIADNLKIIEKSHEVDSRQAMKLMLLALLYDISCTLKYK